MENIAIDVKNLSKSFSSSGRRSYVFRTDGMAQLGQRITSSLRVRRDNSLRDDSVKPVLDNISFQVKKGEFVGIIGRNGAGKTTLLRTITGILRPDFGSVQVNGRMAALLSMGAGFNNELTGRQNVFLNAAMQGVMPEVTKHYVEDILAFSELEDSIDMPIKYYSSGMRSRLGFSIAVHILPDIIIIDEALAAGDAAFKRKCNLYLDNVKKEGRTLLFVSHAAAEVERLCDRAVWLDKGKVIHDGVAGEVVKMYRQHIHQTI